MRERGGEEPSREETGWSKLQEVVVEASGGRRGERSALLLMAVHASLNHVRVASPDLGGYGLHDPVAHAVGAPPSWR